MKSIINSLNVFAWMHGLFAESVKTPSRKHRHDSTRHSFRKAELFNPVASSRRATRNMKNHSPRANARNKKAPRH